MTEQDIHRLEHEIQWWHARAMTRPKHGYAGDLARPRARLRFVFLLRRLWSRPSQAARTTIAPANGVVQSGTPSTLELLQAVARGEISPETAYQFLSPRA